MKRVLTALILIPIVVWVILYSPHTAFVGVTAVVASLAFAEYRNIAAAQGSHFPLWPSLFAGLMILIVPSWLLTALVPLLVILALALALRAEDLRHVLPNCGGFALGLFYVFGCWRAGIGLGERNRHWLLYAAALNWVGDIAAYWVGSRFGRHKLAPVVSPKKSWEGAIASGLGSAVFGVIYLGRYLNIPPFEAALVSLAANAAGQLGDLSESALKRGAGMKDSGTTLPGHGGWLDRIDSTLFAMPVVLFWLVHRR